MRIIFWLCLFGACSSLDAQTEKLNLEGAITIGENDNSSPPSGTIRWNGKDFEGFDGTKWMSLTKSDSQNPIVTLGKGLFCDCGDDVLNHYLKFVDEPFKGESIKSGYVDWINVLSYELPFPVKDINNQYGELTFLKSLDRSSTGLQELLLSANIHSKVMLESLRNTDGELLINLKLEGVYVSKIVHEARVGLFRPVEKITLIFEKMTYIYDQLPGPTGEVEICWDFITNSSCN